MRPYVPYEGVDPFQSYQDFPAKTYSSTISSELITVRPEWIVGHFACFHTSPETVAVLSLSKMRTQEIQAVW